MIEPQTKYLNYKKYGKGSKYLITFHGFAQDASVFQLFESSLGADYTLLSFDLFFHGESLWPQDELPIPVVEWISLLEDVLEKEKIERFGVVGFSLGGKVAIRTALELPLRVNKIILVAPDGIQLNPWYKLATGTAFMRTIFRSLNARPSLLVKLIKYICKLRLISDRLAKFAISQVADPNNGASIYAAWVGYRLFTSDQALTIGVIEKHGMEVTVVAGKYDTVIPAHQLKSFATKCTKATFIKLNTGHNSLLKKYHEYLVTDRKTAR